MFFSVLHSWANLRAALGLGLSRGESCLRFRVGFGALWGLGWFRI